MTLVTTRPRLALLLLFMALFAATHSLKLQQQQTVHTVSITSAKKLQLNKSDHGFQPQRPLNKLPLMFRLEFELINMGLSAKHAIKDMMAFLASAASYAIEHNPISFILTTAVKHCSIGIQMRVFKLAFALNELRFNAVQLLQTYWAQAATHETTVIKIALVWIGAISVAMYLMVMGYIFLQNKTAYS